MSPTERAVIEASYEFMLRRLEVENARLRARLEEVQLALGDAAREIPNVAGPVAHRIRMLRESLSGPSSTPGSESE